MASGPTVRSHKEVAHTLHRAGYPDDFIEELLRQLPDPIDVQRDQDIFGRYGLTPERLMDRMGGSP